MNWPETPENGELGDGRFASATDRPATIDELGEIVKRRAAEGHAIYPQGGKTALDYGGIPRSPGVAIDLRGLDRVVDYPVADMTITVEAGITLAALQTILAAEGQRLDVEAPFDDQATIGGIYATDTIGPRRYGNGRPRDQIIGVRFVDGAGEVIKGGGRVVKNVAGYDFPKLMTGSMGTLGILAELTLKVRPLPETSALVWLSVAGPAEVAEILDRLNTSATRPVALELYHDLLEWIFVIGFEGSAASVQWQLDRLKTELDQGELIISQGGEAEPGWLHLVSRFDKPDGCLSFEAHFPTSQALRFLEKLDESRWFSIHAHAGNGVVQGKTWIDFDLETIAPEIDGLRALARSLGGSLTLPRCPTDWKTRLKVWGDPRPDWFLAERVKQALDPRGVLNPGRFVGAI